MTQPKKPAQERVGLMDGIHAYGVIDGAWRAAGEPRSVPVTGGRLEFVPTVCGLEIGDPPGAAVPRCPGSHKKPVRVCPDCGSEMAVFGEQMVYHEREPQRREPAPEAFVERLRELLGTNAEVGNEDCLREVQHVRELAQRLYPVAIGGLPPLATHLEWAVDAARKAERALTIQTATELYASMARKATKEEGRSKPAKKRGKR